MKTGNTGGSMRYKTKDKEGLKSQCRELKLSAEGKKHQLARRLVESQNLPLPPSLEKYNGDLELLPHSVTELAKLSIFKLREILRFHNVLDCGTKNELAIRVAMVKSGRSHPRIYERISCTKKSRLTLIQFEKQMYFIDQKIIVKKRKFPTQSSPAISTSHPQDTASVFTKQIKAFVPVPAGIDMITLDKIFDELTDEISLYSAEESSFDAIVSKLKGLEKANLDAIKTVGADVLAFWSKDEIGKTGWKSGWYKAKVIEYNKETDNAKLEFDPEKGNQYIYSVEKEAKANRLKLAKVVKGRWMIMKIFLKLARLSR